MLGGEGPASLHFDYKTVLDEQVGHVKTRMEAIFIGDFELFLLFNVQPGPAETMSRAILINPLEMPVS
jgi:hypothetical protein